MRFCVQITLRRGEKSHIETIVQENTKNSYCQTAHKFNFSPLTKRLYINVGNSHVTKSFPRGRDFCPGKLESGRVLSGSGGGKEEEEEAKMRAKNVSSSRRSQIESSSLGCVSRELSPFFPSHWNCGKKQLLLARDY